MLPCHPSTRPATRSRGFSIPELLVSLVVLLLLMAVAMPPLLHSREISHHRSCQTNLKEIGAALGGFHKAHNCFPNRYGTVGKIVPFLEFPTGTLGNTRKARSLDNFRCPSDPLAAEIDLAMSYCWNTGRGMESTEGSGFMPFRENAISQDDFPDGVGFTAAASETRIYDIDSTNPKRHVWRVSNYYPKLDETHLRDEDRPLLLNDCVNVPQDDDHMAYSQRGTDPDHEDEYTHFLTPNQNSCGSANIAGTIQFELFTANSEHPGGVYLLLVDGSVRFISDRIDANVWTALSTRNGSEIVRW